MKTKLYFSSTIIMGLLASSCSGPQTSTKENEESQQKVSINNTKQNLADEIAQRVNAIYQEVFSQYDMNEFTKAENTSQYMSSRYNAAVEAANIWCNNHPEDCNGQIQAWNSYDPWIQGQDFCKNLKAYVTKVQCLSQTEAIVYLSITNCMSTTKVKLKMIYENNNWVIDERITYFENGAEYSESNNYDTTNIVSQSDTVVAIEP